MIKKILYVVFSIITIVILYFSLLIANEKGNRIKVDLDRCVDGDTAWFIVNEEVVKVRFLGIDTPEIKHNDKEAYYYGGDAKEFTCTKLKDAKEIYLEFDNNSDKYDKYKRLLAWVFVDDKNLSELLVENGYALVRYIYHDYYYVKDLCRAQDRAYKKNIGIWKEKRDEYSNNYCNKR